MSDNYLWIKLPNINKILCIVDSLCISGVDEDECVAKWNKFSKLKGTIDYIAMQLALQDTIDIWQDLERIQIEYNLSKAG